MFDLYHRSSITAAICMIASHVGLAQDSAAKLWDDEQPVPKAADLASLVGIRFTVIQPYQRDQDGYDFLHGVALAWHKGKLYASFGHNKGAENTAGEEARGRVSADGGRTWSDAFTVDVGDGPDLAVSHGVFLSHAGQLWAFQGAFAGRRQNVHTRAYLLDEKSGAWLKKGVVVEGGFWPMQEPQKMADGNWIMAGFCVAPENPAAVAISRGEDFTHWRLIQIPAASPIKPWGESTVLIRGSQIVNVSRSGAPQALLATSSDFGQTWTKSAPSNLPMVTSKPYAGTLTTGQNYLIGTTTADPVLRRSPLTIAVSRPGGGLFCKVYRIRNSEHEGPGESSPRAALSYPYAVEHEGQLYVGYSNGGLRGGNRNSAELAVIPVTSLTAD